MRRLLRGLRRRWAGIAPALLLACVPLAASAQATLPGIQAVWPTILPAPHLLTSASATTCTTIATGATSLYFVHNANAAAQTSTLTLFDDVGTCAAADTRGTYILTLAQVVSFGTFGMTLVNGLSYTLSASLATGGPVVLQASR